MNTNIIQTRTGKFIVTALILVLLIVSGLVLFNRSNAQKEAAPSDTPVPRTISAGELEEQYGLRVYLVALTGAGSFVDVRMKIVNGEKARLLLTDKKNFPTVISSNNIVLNAPEDTKSQEVIFKDDMDMFIMYLNSSNTVTPGSQVRIAFGDTVLEPITVLH